ncbi:MAG: NADP-dependent phosphogluconate dehydrogenase [Candidatus Saccharimonadales bacterium]
MKLVIVGQGKMGAQISMQLLEAGHQVTAMDPNPASLTAAVQKGAQTSTDRAQAAAQFVGQSQPPIIWLMIPSPLVEAELAAWLEVLPAASIIVDGGNSDFRDSQKRGQLAAQKSIDFVDVGVSGGVLGLEKGFSMMVGGKQAAYQTLEPVFKAMAKDQGGYQYFGPDYGAGHFVKMVHNGIEYGVMESLAEGYRLLHDGPYQGLDLAAAGHVWQRGSVIESELNALAAQALKANPELSGVDGYVAESGEARWALEAAKDKQIDMPAIQIALEVRKASQQGQVNFATKLLAELRNQFGGHDINKPKPAN